MKRKSAARLHPTRALLALLLVSLVNLSCSKDAPLLEPSHSATGSRGTVHAGGSFSSGLDYVPDEAVVTLKPGASLNDYLNAQETDLVTTLALPDAGSIPAETYYLVRSRDGRELNLSRLTLDARARTVSSHNRVWIPEDDRGGLPFDDDDTWRLGGDYYGQDAIANVRIPEARTITQGTGEIIAILDTGIDHMHQLFLLNHVQFSFGENYTVLPPVLGVTESLGNDEDEDGDGHADDGIGHGTHVTGIAFTGAKKATFRIYKVLDEEGRGTAFGLAMAIKAAADYGVQVINLSLGLTDDDCMIHHAIAYCADRGIAVVASAGNRGTDVPQYPAAYDEVISVAAVDNSDKKPDFASFGPTVDISAPGVDIVSPIPRSFGNPRYAIASGSSMATAFVSAAIALNHARSPYLSPREAAAGVLSGTIDIKIPNLGSGRVDFYNPIHHINVE